MPCIEMKAVLLVGGLGTRLRSIVSGIPKPLAPVGNRPFLELLIRQLRFQGIRRLVMCTGYLAEHVENQFGDGSSWDVAIEYSKEQHALGTAGALKLAQPYLRNVSDFVLMNGDSFLELDLQELIRFHSEQKALVTMATTRVRANDSSRYGTVQVDGSNRVIGFAGKTCKNPSTSKKTPRLINAGIYIFNRAVLEQIPEGPLSLERDVFPGMVRGGGLYALEQHGMFIDIGTPEDYTRAHQISDRLIDAVAVHKPCKVNREDKRY